MIDLNDTKRIIENTPINVKDFFRVETPPIPERINITERVEKQLEYNNLQTKQLNDKIAEQTYQLKLLKAELDEEKTKRELLERKLSKKDFKLWAGGILSAIISGVLVIIIQNVITNLNI